jgi:hypothetical protein
MKKLFIINVFFFLTLISASAINEKQIEAKISDVVVYQQGAQITRTSKVHLAQGKVILLFKGLSSKIDPASIQVECPDEVTIVSVVHGIDYLNLKESNDVISNLEREKTVLADSISNCKNILEVYKQEKDMIISNKTIGGQENGLQISELLQASNFFRSRLTELEKLSYFQLKKIKDFQIRQIKIAQQLVELNSQKDKPTSIIRVTVNSNIVNDAPIVLRYLIDNAGWQPGYDIRIKDINHPIRLTYKAIVSQNTDEDWDNVNLKLSTGNPSISNYKPELSTYQLTFDNYYSINPYIKTEDKSSVQGNVHGRVKDLEQGEALPGVTVMIKGTTVGTVTDLDGNYSINAPTGSTLIYSFVGYMPEEIVVNSKSIDISLATDIQHLDEVVVVGYGTANEDSWSNSGNSKSLYETIRASSKKKDYIPLAVQQHQTTTEFKIDIPYSIPSDDKNYDVTMVEYEIPAEFTYSCVPKLSDNAYLIAKITNWSAYNLLDGNANLFYEGIYQGQTYLNLKNFEDTLNLSIGRDHEIIVDRKIQTNFVDKSFMGTTKKETRSWEINLRNNKEYPVSLTIEDQYPISSNTDIKVDQIEQSGAVLDESTGKLIWNIRMLPGENRKLNVKYSVKYPKDRRLIVD